MFVGKEDGGEAGIRILETEISNLVMAKVFRQQHQAAHQLGFHSTPTYVYKRPLYSTEVVASSMARCPGRGGS